MLTASILRHGYTKIHWLIDKIRHYCSLHFLVDPGKGWAARQDHVDKETTTVGMVEFKVVLNLLTLTG